MMKTPRIDIGRIRREQIVEAAVAIIAEQGLQNLSLSEIETRAGMSRGQLTYYFKTKESILLAVFDRLLQEMYQRVGAPCGEQACAAVGFAERFGHLLKAILAEPPVSPEFHCLQFTFLAQIGHRDDFRRRLADLYEGWRSRMAQGLAEARSGRAGRVPRSVSPRTLATLIQAILHGLAVQLAADPAAVDRTEMLELCLDLTSTYLGAAARPSAKNRPAAGEAVNGARRKRSPTPRRPVAKEAVAANGSAARGTSPRSSTTQRVNHE
jgi:AcrR family transcriptional regulator